MEMSEKNRVNLTMCQIASDIVSREQTENTRELREKATQYLVAMFDTTFPKRPEVTEGDQLS